MFESNVATWILLAAAAGLLIYMKFGPIKGVRNISSEAFAKLLETSTGKFIIIDVREAHEYKRGHIRGAKNVPLSQLTNHLEEIPADTSLLLYCQSGMRSRQAARTLSKRGYQDIVNLNGGIMSWQGQTVR